MMTRRHMAHPHFGLCPAHSGCVAGQAAGTALAEALGYAWHLYGAVETKDKGKLGGLVSGVCVAPQNGMYQEKMSRNKTDRSAICRSW